MLIEVKCSWKETLPGRRESSPGTEAGIRRMGRRNLGESHRVVRAS